MMEITFHASSAMCFGDGCPGDLSGADGSELPHVVVIILVVIEDIGEWVAASADIRLVWMAQALAVKAVMALAEALLLTLSALPCVFDMNNAPAMILPRHTTPRSLRSSAVIGRGGKGIILCAV